MATTTCLIPRRETMNEWRRGWGMTAWRGAGKGIGGLGGGGAGGPFWGVMFVAGGGGGVIICVLGGERRERGRKKPRRSAGRSKAGTLIGKLVRIGNSRGVRLPKTVIEQAGLSEDISIAVVGDRVILRSAGAAHPRAGWEEQIKAALAEHGD